MAQEHEREMKLQPAEQTNTQQTMRHSIPLASVCLAHSLPLSLFLTTGMGHSLALRLSLWGRSTRIYECANVYDNFAHKCKLLPQTPPLTCPLSTPSAARAWPTGTSWVAHPPQLCGKPSERGRGRETESKMRVHILHGIPHKHHVGSSSLSLSLRHTQSILYLKLKPHLLIVPAATVHCSVHCAHFTIFSSYVSAHTHSHTHSAAENCVPVLVFTVFYCCGHLRSTIFGLAARIVLRAFAMQFLPKYREKFMSKSLELRPAPPSFPSLSLSPPT